jgi:hypothetical protein
MLVSRVGCLMADYRLYCVNKDNHFDGPPALVMCDSDGEAIKKADRRAAEAAAVARFNLSEEQRGRLEIRE